MKKAIKISRTDMSKITQQPSEIPRTSKQPGGIINRTTDPE